MLNHVGITYLHCTPHSVAVGVLQKYVWGIRNFDELTSNFIDADQRILVGQIIAFGDSLFGALGCGHWGRGGPVWAHAGLRVGSGPMSWVARGFWRVDVNNSVTRTSSE